MRNPIKVTVRSIILDEGIKESKVKTVYIATFADGSVEKVEKTRVKKNDLIIPSELTKKTLSKDDCPLYHMGNWAKWGDIVVMRNANSPKTYRKESPVAARFVSKGKKVVEDPTYSAGKQVQSFLNKLTDWCDYNMMCSSDDAFRRIKEAARCISYAYASWRIKSSYMGIMMNMTTISMFNLVYEVHQKVSFLNQESVAEFLNNKTVKS